MTKEQMIILNGVVSFVLAVSIGFIIGVMAEQAYASRKKEDDEKKSKGRKKHR